MYICFIHYIFAFLSQRGHVTVNLLPVLFLSDALLTSLNLLQSVGTVYHSRWNTTHYNIQGWGSRKPLTPTYILYLH